MAGCFGCAAVAAARTVEKEEGFGVDAEAGWCVCDASQCRCFRRSKENLLPAGPLEKAGLFCCDVSKFAC